MGAEDNATPAGGSAGSSPAEGLTGADLAAYLATQPKAGVWFVFDAEGFSEEAGAYMRQALTDAFVHVGRLDYIPVFGQDIGLTEPEEIDETEQIINEILGIQDTRNPAWDLTAEQALPLAVANISSTVRIQDEGVIPANPEVEESQDEILIKVAWSNAYLRAGETTTMSYLIYGKGVTREEALINIATQGINYIVENLIIAQGDVDSYITQILPRNTIIGHFAEAAKAGDRFYMQERGPGGVTTNRGSAVLLGDVEAGKSQEIQTFYANPYIGYELVPGYVQTINIVSAFSFPIVGEDSFFVQELTTTTPLPRVDGVYYGIGVGVPTDTTVEKQSLFVKGVVGSDVFAWTTGTTRILFGFQGSVGYRWNSWRWFVEGQTNLRVEAFLGLNTMLTLGVGANAMTPLSNPDGSGLRFGAHVALGLNWFLDRIDRNKDRNE